MGVKTSVLLRLERMLLDLDPSPTRTRASLYPPILSVRYLDGEDHVAASMFATATSVWQPHRRSGDQRPFRPRGPLAASNSSPAPALYGTLLPRGGPETPSPVVGSGVHFRVNFRLGNGVHPQIPAHAPILARQLAQEPRPWDRTAEKLRLWEGADLDM